MKYMAILLAVLVLTVPVFANAPSGGQGTTTTMQGSGLGNGSVEQVQQEQQTENMGENQSLLIQIRERLMARNASELGEMIRERQQIMNQEMQSLGDTQQKIYQNQNRVRLAVHAMLAMENLTGGIGRNISQIAREFNNSVQATIRAEERVQTRNFIMNFFFGGDEQAAGELEQEVNRNQVRIQELKRLMNECECAEEVKSMLHEQIQSMEQEQNRLQQLSQEQKNSKGLFGWLWK